MFNSAGSRILLSSVTTIKSLSAPKVRITERPEAINARLEFGHCDGDLIEDSARSPHGYVVLPLLERKSRFSVYVGLPNKESVTVYNALKLFFEDLSPDLRRSTKSIHTQKPPR